jgi:hypothetical protein
MAIANLNTYCKWRTGKQEWGGGGRRIGAVLYHGLVIHVWHKIFDVKLTKIPDVS